MKFYLLIPLIILIVSGCDSAPNKVEYAPKGSITENCLLVCNEGNFNWSNASLSLINTADNTVNNDVFYSVNQQKLGDVLQSAGIINNNLYLIINNSAKIEVAEKETLKSVGSILGLKSPRYMMQVNTTTAYVSDLYDNAISVVNLNNNTISKKISMPGWTEEMLLQNNLAYITNVYRDYVLIINTLTHTVTDTIFCGYGSNSIVADKNNNIWILSTGNTGMEKKGSLSCYQIKDKLIYKQFIFNSGIPKKLIINKEKDKLYWLNNGHVYSMQINDEQLPLQAFISGNGKNFYGLDFYNAKNSLIVTDAKDYLQQGDVLMYDTYGKLLNTYKVGLIPNEICFF